MLSVEEARGAILDGAARLDAEFAPLDALTGRVAAADIKAAVTQPPFPASAMDGYAVRFADAAKAARLSVIGEAPAGAPFNGELGAGQAVRIFTGAVVPKGADHVVIQEDVAREGDEILITEAQEQARNIRPAGVDFHAGDLLMRAGDQFHEVHGAILAAANLSTAKAVRRPRVAIFANGDELKEPGGALGPGEIVNSNHYAIAALVARWGGEAVYLGCAPDAEDAVAEMFQRGAAHDVIVPIGGASVGDYDFVKSAFAAAGGENVFSKVAVRPGKPTWFGRLGGARVLGLPGNPASALVTSALFLQPLIGALLGKAAPGAFSTARLGAAVGANGPRESYLRALTSEGGAVVTPVANQDSSLLSPYLSSDVLIRRAPGAAALEAGAIVDVAPIR